MPTTFPCPAYSPTTRASTSSQRRARDYTTRLVPTLIAPHLRLPGSKCAFAEMFKRKSVIFRVNKSHDVACARQQGCEMDFPAKSSSRSSAEERERDGRTHPIHADSLAKTINFFIASCESHNRLVNINLHALDGLSRLVNGFQ